MYRYIVVDDEIGTLEATSNFVSRICNEYELAGRFTDGSEAWEFLQKNSVDLVITDIKMPCMNGIELTKKITENGINCKIIIISGYHDFEYARSAFKYGVVDYITKPINLAEFSHILLNIKNNFDEERNSEEIINLKREQFLSDLFFGSIGFDEAVRTFTELDFSFTLANFKGAVLQIEFLNIDDLINSKWKHEKEQLDMLIKNVLCSMTECNLYSLSHNKNTIKFIVFAEIVENEMLATLRSEVEDILQSPVKTDIIFKFDSLQEIIDKRVYKNNESDCMMMLVSYIKEGKIDLANDLYNHILMQFSSDNSQSGSSDKINETVQRIKDFIEDNYNLDIGRSDVAGHVYMNEVYAGRIFKQVTGKSIHDYHMEIRLRKAIEILGNGEKISYICKRIGYNDKRKFIRHFKKFTGYTPTEYKEKVLKLPME